MNTSVINKNSNHLPCCSTHLFNWTPVILGALIAIGLGFLLDLFVQGLGLTLYTANVEGATALAIGGFLGIAIGSIVSMFIAGFASGFFAAACSSRKNLGMVYGFAAWCLSLILLAGFSSGLAAVAYHADTEKVMASTQEMGLTAEKVSSRLHPATDVHDTSGEHAARAAGMFTFSLFLLFFIGALSASAGGHYGYASWYKSCEIEKEER